MTIQKHFQEEALSQVGHACQHCPYYGTNRVALHDDPLVVNHALAVQPQYAVKPTQRGTQYRYDLFLSYHAPDRAAARTLVAQLKQAGFCPCSPFAYFFGGSQKWGKSRWS